MDLKELLNQETTVNQHIATKVKVKKKKNKDGVYPLKVTCEFGFDVENPDIDSDTVIRVINEHFRGMGKLDSVCNGLAKLFGGKETKKEEKEEK